MSTEHFRWAATKCLDWMFRGITPLATTSIVLLLSTHTYGQGSANLITAPEFVAPVKLIDRTAQIPTKLAYGFSGEGERFRLHIVLEGDLTEARNQLTKDLARTWRQTDCKGDDLKTDNVSISPTGDALRARFDFRFVRWWSVSNCAFDRNYQFEAEGPAAIDMKLEQSGGEPQLVGTISHFQPQLDVLGIPFNQARAVVQQKLEAELQTMIAELNAELVLPPQLAATEPTLHSVEFREVEGGGLETTVVASALVSAEQLNEILRLVMTPDGQ